MNCPKCGSTDLRTSKHAHWGDIFQRARGREAIRCRKCRLRFFVDRVIDANGKETIAQSTHRPKSVKLLSSRTKHRLAKRLVVISIFAVAFIVFWLFLRYLTTERMPGSDSGAVRFHISGTLS
jgi:hypothetical protein